MSMKEKIKKEIAALVEEGLEIAKSLHEKKEGFSFVVEYQIWYSKALKVLEVLAPDRYDEFRRYYEPDPKRKDMGYGSYVIQDFIKNVVPSRAHYPNFNSSEQAAHGVLNQYTLLLSIAERIDSVLSNIAEGMFADLKDAELITATKLMSISPRAAGALAGVVLEDYLQKVAENHKVKINKKTPTLSDLNDPLKQAGVYDTASWRKISYLADIRNMCSHKKAAEPTIDQVKELIDGVNWAVKNIL